MAESIRERIKRCYSVFRTSYYYNFVLSTSLWCRHWSGGLRALPLPGAAQTLTALPGDRGTDTALCGSPVVAAGILSLRPRSGLVVGRMGQGWTDFRGRSPIGGRQGTPAGLLPRRALRGAFPRRRISGRPRTWAPTPSGVARDPPTAPEAQTSKGGIRPHAVPELSHCGPQGETEAEPLRSPSPAAGSV